MSGSTDRTLRVWDADSGDCTHVLYGHTSTVRCLALHGEKVVSGSRDGTLRVWDIIRGGCLHVLVGHNAAVRWYADLVITLLPCRRPCRRPCRFIEICFV